MTIKEFMCYAVGLIQASVVEVLEADGLNAVAEFHESEKEWAITKFRRSAIFEDRELAWFDVLSINNKITLRIVIRKEK